MQRGQIAYLHNGETVLVLEPGEGDPHDENNVPNFAYRPALVAVLDVAEVEMGQLARSWEETSRFQLEQEAATATAATPYASEQDLRSQIAQLTQLVQQLANAQNVTGAKAPSAAPAAVAEPVPVATEPVAPIEPEPAAAPEPVVPGVPPVPAEPVPEPVAPVEPEPAAVPPAEPAVTVIGPETVAGAQQVQDTATQAGPGDAPDAAPALPAEGT